VTHFTNVLSMVRGQKVTKIGSTGVIFSQFQNLIKLHLILKEIAKYTQINGFASECDLLIQKYRSPKVGYKGHVKAICSEGFTETFCTGVYFQ